MSVKRYKKVRRRRPELELPEWSKLPSYRKREIQRMSPEQLIAEHAYAILSRDVTVQTEVLFWDPAMCDSEETVVSVRYYSPCPC